MKLLEAQAITPDCRRDRGFDGAWDEAVRRLREIYDAQVNYDPGYTLSLAIYRGDHRDSQAGGCAGAPSTSAASGETGPPSQPGSAPTEEGQA